MPKPPIMLILILACASVATVATLYLGAQSAAVPQNASSIVSDSTDGQPTAALAADSGLSQPLSPQNPDVSGTAPSDDNNNDNDAGEDYRARAEALEDSLAASMPDLMAQYEEASRYPPGSQPIRSVDDLQQYLPNQASDVSAPFPGEVPGDDISLSIQLDKYQYVSGESIIVALTLQPANTNSLTAADAVILLKDRDGKIFGQQPAEPVGDEASSGQAGDFRASGVMKPGPSVPAGDLFVEVVARFTTTLSGGERTASMIAPLQYEPAVAQLTAVIPAFTEGSELVVPLQFNVSSAGYYFVAANLYTKDGRPLIHLQSEGRLEAGSGQQTLRAHISALKSAGEEGPYVLQDFNIQRAAESGESSNLPGAAPDQPYTVQGFDFSDYEDSEYADPLAEERREFLEKLGTL